jgi:predicted transcriptional regulator YheO
MNWSPYIAIADALAALLPQTEAVLHDIAENRILHIAGAFSRRRAGDPSLTDIADLQPFDQRIIGPYEKINVDGRRLKSISVVIPAEGGRPVGLLCINMDISAFDLARTALERLIALPAAAHAEAAHLFPSDWREGINAEIGDFLAGRGLALAALTVAEQVELVTRLDRQGFFAIRKAADHIAAALGVSRATLYKRLTAARPSQNGNPP